MFHGWFDLFVPDQSVALTSWLIRQSINMKSQPWLLLLLDYLSKNMYHTFHWWSPRDVAGSSRLLLFLNLTVFSKLGMNLQACAPLTVISRYLKDLIHELPPFKVQPLPESRWREAEWNHPGTFFTSRVKSTKWSRKDWTSLFLHLCCWGSCPGFSVLTISEAREALRWKSDKCGVEMWPMFQV